MNKFRLLDDFSQETSSLGTPWEGFTDQVMGGVSEISVLRVKNPDGNYIRMSGNVSLENNGGFIQVRLKLAEGLSVFDGSEYDGIRIRVRGEGNSYFLFLRTNTTLLPWQFYKAKIPVSEVWRTVDIPWDQFTKGDYGTFSKLRSNRVKSIALVAYGENFQAMVELTEIGLYKE
ncbi:MAG: CIA30 family protein [Spirochaetales bacterium]|nr:CIA30 family protein [Spirochaetales bacterium]